MKIKIDKDVPLPPRGPFKKENAVRDAILVLEIGDSFWVSSASVGKGFQSSVVQLAARCDRRVTTRREADGFRVWRTG